MIYVLDQNYFRSDELKALVSAEPKAKFVIPDVALLEMCKGDKWRETMQCSLRTLAACTGRVFSSMAVGEALRFELESLNSIEGRLLPRRFAEFIRSVFADIKAESSTAGIGIIKKGIYKAQEGIRGEELDHARNQHSLTTRTKIIEQVLAGDPLKQLKNGIVDDKNRLKFIKTVGTDLLTNHLVNDDIPRNKIRSFIRQKPLTLRYFYLSVRHALEWARKGGLDSFPAEKFTNDILDQDYVVIASFFDRMLSKETKVLQADADLRAILKMVG